MFGLGECVLVVSLVLAASLVMLLNVRIPKGFQEPMKLRLFLAGVKLSNIKKAIMERIYSVEDCLRVNRNNLANAGAAADLTNIQTVDTELARVAVRIYTPIRGTSSDAAVIFFHGGGWVWGSYNGRSNIAMAKMTRRLKITVISVDYRLAPENPYPVPFNDCVAVTKYFMEHAQNYGVNPNRIALMGASAGGNLIAAVSLRLRDEGYRYRPKLQALFYPALQAIDFCTPSYQLFKEEPRLSKKGMVRFWLWYACGHLNDIDAAMANMHTSPAVKKQMLETKLSHAHIPADLLPANYQQPDLESGDARIWKKFSHVFLDPYFAPLMAEDLSGLPQAYIVTAGQDVLRDDGFLYAQRLRAAGNDVTHEHMEFVFHALLNMSDFQDFYLAWEKIYDHISEKL